MIDFSTVKKVTIPEGEVKQIAKDGVVLWKSGYKNWVRYSTESDGTTIYNGGLGYKNGYRIRSGGVEGENARTTCTGFIPVKGGDIVRISGCDFTGANNGNAINVSDSSFANTGQFTMLTAAYGILAAGAAYGDYNHTSVVEETAGVWKWVVPPAASGVAYIRVSAWNSTATYPGENLIVTINEEIT